jgi:uncharacterized protein YqfA (UPF0365 family)
MPIIIALAIAAAGFVGIVVLVLGSMGFKLVITYINAKAANANCPFPRLVGMRLRKLDPGYLVENMIGLRNAGVDATYEECESHVMSGGCLEDAVDAMISAHKAGLDVTFRRICAIDLTGRDIVRAIQSCVNPITIDIPHRGSKQKYIMGVAKDGIQLGVNVKVTAKADINRLVGGASEKTIAARVGEGIVSTIGSADNHKNILQTPDLISEKILSRGLDANTAFSIISVDVGDIEVVNNIGAKLAQDQADADQLVAQARAEGRRAIAKAVSRENLAKVRDMVALETLNRAEIPKDMARSYQVGNIFRSPNPVHSVIRRKLWESS